LILGTKQTLKQVESYIPFIKRKNIFVISALTFHPELANNGITSFVSLLAVADSSLKMPSGIDAWRRIGFGSLMINSLIKQSSSISDNPEVDVYLQCEENSAFNFYCNLAFQQVNAYNTDGFGLLPDNLRNYFNEIKAATKEGQCTFLFQSKIQCESNTPFPLKLMHLRHGQLHTLVPNFNAKSSCDDSSNDDNDTIQELPFNVDSTWCQYPRPRTDQEWKRMLLLNKTHVGFFKQLPILQTIFPIAFMQSPISAMLLDAKGDMTIKSRLEHSETKGTKWFKSSEIDLMLSLLLSDGRYHGKCFVVSSFLAQKISIAFAAFVKYKQLLEQQKLNKSKIEDSGLKTEVDLAKTAYANHKEHLIKTVMRKNLGILRRKIIVFPFCKASIHWTVTFVMNASQVLEKQHAEESSSSPTQAKNTSPRACFYRYDPNQQNGKTAVPIAQGIKWFLNLCASYEEHRKMDDANAAMSWIEPFGSELVDNMHGTERFPALLVMDENIFFPK
jgi:hypothetical protein